MPEQTFVRTRNEDVVHAVNDLPQVQAADAWIHGKKRAARSEKEEYLLDSVAELHEHMAEVGVRPVSIISSYPVEIHSTGPITERYVVPKCDLGVAYIHYVIKSYATEVVCDPASGWEKVKVILPLTIARDILQQHDRPDGTIYGGITIYMGDHEPNPTNLKDHDANRKKMEAHFRKLVNDANLEWARPDKSGRRNITDTHRHAALYLHHYRYIKELPGWVTKIELEEKDKPEPLCPACGAEPKKGAFQCGACGWIVKPIDAYNAGAIDGSNIALARVSREELKAAGLSDLVEETLEERKAREKKEAKAKK